MAGEARRRRLRALLRKAHVAPTELAEFEHAFVHESAARERRKHSNERLEFLGDAVVGLAAAGWLFEEHPQASEGWLTARKAAIVRDSSLAATALRLGFADLVELGSGLTRAGGAENKTILADAFEAFVGALYRRYGEVKARRFVLEQHMALVDLSDEGVTDPKSLLQALAQQRYRKLPVYRDRSTGTAQAPHFVSEVALDDRVLGSGAGRSKKIAQLQAAHEALQLLLARARRGKKK
jgi:ribonuclease-3